VFLATRFRAPLPPPADLPVAAAALSRRRGIFDYGVGLVIDTGFGLEYVTCPSTSFCVAADDARVMTSTNPTGGPAAWSAPVSLVRSSWSDGLAGLACPAITFCAASSFRGRVFASVDPMSRAAHWTNSRPINIGLVGESGPIMCPSSSLCFVTGSDLIFGLRHLTTPSASATIFRFGEPNGVGVGGCWQAMCALLGSPFVTFSTSPAPSARAWGKPVVAEPVGAVAGIVGISCVGRHFCALADSNGYVITGSPNAVSRPGYHYGQPVLSRTTLTGIAKNQPTLALTCRDPGWVLRKIVVSLPRGLRLTASRGILAKHLSITNTYGFGGGQGIGGSTRYRARVVDGKLVIDDVVPPPSGWNDPFQVQNDVVHIAIAAPALVADRSTVLSTGRRGAWNTRVGVYMYDTDYGSIYGNAYLVANLLRRVHAT
jgi:hypothetical protein